MYTSIHEYCDQLITNYNEIDPHRKKLLEKIADYIQQRLNKVQAVSLVYVCTHNSRRSHFGQIWAKVAAEYYNIKNVHTYSGGTA